MMQLRKLVSSVSEGGVTLEGLTVEVEHGVFEKFISLTLAYGKVLTDVGRIQYAFLFVTVSESLRLHSASMAHSNEATWEQLSKTSHAITMGRQNFARVFTHDPRGQRPFLHSLRMINLKIKRSSYYIVKNRRSMREEGTTA